VTTPPAPESGRLADGGRPATPEDLFRRLRELGIPFTTAEHAPVFTVEQAKVERGRIPGSHTKNLFLRDKKERMWLLVCLEDRTIDLKVLAGQLGADHLSFGSAGRLMRYLGLTPGAVTPFGVMNDRARKVRVVLDRAVLEQEPLNFHPLVNRMTTSIGAADFLRFLEAEGHRPQIVDL
jgi:Ala-tRNA(Pro) deacylase